jgi:hypothetical protein
MVTTFDVLGSAGEDWMTIHIPGVDWRCPALTCSSDSDISFAVAVTAAARLSSCWLSSRMRNVASSTRLARNTCRCCLMYACTGGRSRAHRIAYVDRFDLRAASANGRPSHTIRSRAALSLRLIWTRFGLSEAVLVCGGALWASIRLIPVSCTSSRLRFSVGFAHALDGQCCRTCGCTGFEEGCNAPLVNCRICWAFRYDCLLTSIGIIMGQLHLYLY